MDSEIYRKAFIANHSRLVRKLTPSELVQATFTNNLITQTEKEEIESLRTESRQLNKLLGIFHRRYYSDPDVFKKLFEVLKEVNNDEGGYIDHVIQALERTLNAPPTLSTSHDLFKEGDRARLRLHEATIITTLDVRQILPDLISEGIVTFEESESVDSVVGFQERAVKFLKYLTSRGSDSYQRFINVLLDTDVYEQLAYQLRGNEEMCQEIESDKYVEDVLKRGHVPPPPQNYTRRPDLIRDIRRELRKLKDTDSWVLVCGLPGYGKTVLAAESLRSSSLLREVFIGGVYWLSVGRMYTKEGEIDMPALLEKLQNFIVRMDKDRHRPSNLESATDYLQTVMNEQYPQSLLVLDDIWEPETAQYFAVRCRTLATSRNADVANAISTNNVYQVSVMEGFTVDEGKTLLSKATSLPVDKLPSAASKIIRLCHGSPIALDIISAMLQRNATPARWVAVIDRLTKQHAGKLVMKTGSIGTPDLSIRRGSEVKRGRTKETLNTSISLSEESLPLDVRECFHMLVVFEPDTVITTEVLATLWNKEPYDAEDYMMAIVGWSLAQKALSQKSADGYLSFIVHDLILDYLQDTVPSQEKLIYHQELVERYSEKCGGDFSQLEPDGYIHQKLLSHLVSAKQFELLGKLLANVLWLTVSCHFWDPNSLLQAYKKYRNSIPDSYRQTTNELQLFLSSHLDVLGNANISTQDVVQLILNTSYEKLVEQAKMIARSDKDTPWFDWGNRSSINRPSPFLQVQPHRHEDIRYCQYFDEGLKVLSCSSNQAKIWEASTGKVLESFSGHSNSITHCVISETGDILVTSSDDKTCKVWEVVPKKLVQTFSAHVDGVQCCDLSRDSQLVVSGDIGSAVKVWFSCNGKIEEEWDHGDTGVTSCAFIPRGDAIIVSSQEGLLSLYNLKGSSLATFAIVTSPINSPSIEFDLSLSHGPSRTSSTGSNTAVNFSIHKTVFSKDSSLLAAAVGDCSAKVWSVDTSQCMYSFRHSSDVLCVDFSPDGKLLVTGCVSGTVKVWSLAEGGKGCPLLDLPLHYDWITNVKFSPQGLNILSSSASIISFIQNQQRKKSWKLYHRRFVTRFSSTEDGHYLPSLVCYDTVKRKLEICEGTEGRTVQVLATVPHKKPRSWDMSHDMKLVAVGYDNGLLQLFDVVEQKEVWLNEAAHDNPILNCYFSPNDNRIISCEEFIQKVWSTDNGSLLSCQPDCSNFRVKSCLFFDDGIKVASTTPGRVLVWDSSSNKKLFYCEGISEDPRESILCVNISKDNKRLIASATNGRIAVWGVESGERLFIGSYVSSSGNSQARSCSLNWNGSVAAVGHDDSTLKIYHIETGGEIVCGSSYTTGTWLISALFSPDNKQIMTLSNSIQWWSIDGKKQKQFLLKTFGKHLNFSPDFRLFVTIDNTGFLYILKLIDVC